MTDSSAIKNSADLLADLALELRSLLDGARTEPRGVHTKYLALFLVYTVRQVRAICLLVGCESTPFYAEQAGQLLRGLCEICIKAAWMMAPDDDNERNSRALRMDKASIKREKLSDGQKRELFKLHSIGGSEGGFADLKGLPTLRDMSLESCPPHIYDIFRFESSSLHVSLSTLFTTVHSYNLDERRVTFDGPDPPDSRARRLLATFDVLLHITRLLIIGLELDSDAWGEAEVRTHNVMVGVLSPLLLTSD